MIKNTALGKWACGFSFSVLCLFHKCVCWLPPGSAGETWCWWVSIWAYRSGSEPQRGLCWGWVMGASLNLLLERLAEQMSTLKGALMQAPRHLGPCEGPPRHTPHWLRALLPFLQGVFSWVCWALLELLLCFPGKGNTPRAVFGVIRFPVKTVSKSALISDKEV